MRRSLVLALATALLSLVFVSTPGSVSPAGAAVADWVGIAAA